MGAQNGSVSGERLVNFDVNVVGPNGTAPISYNQATNSCTLACHGHVHTAIAAPGASPALRSKRSAP
jgi:hypothetical protein